MFGLPADTAAWLLIVLLIGLSPMVHYLIVHAREGDEERQTCDFRGSNEGGR